AHETNQRGLKPAQLTNKPAKGTNQGTKHQGTSCKLNHVLGDSAVEPGWVNPNFTVRCAQARGWFSPHPITGRG
ncbi:MAG: hypothetical protein AAF471_05045, partial [Myxococcota bacterium]